MGGYGGSGCKKCAGNKWSPGGSLRACKACGTAAKSLRAAAADGSAWCLQCAGQRMVANAAGNGCGERYVGRRLLRGQERVRG